MHLLESVNTGFLELCCIIQFVNKTDSVPFDRINNHQTDFNGFETVKSNER